MQAYNFKDLTGQRFGRLVVIERCGTRQNHAIWKCKCDCGNETESYSGNLLKGVSKSCGCLNKEIVSKTKKTHGRKPAELYEKWCHIKARCVTVKEGTKDYNNYKGRGIAICDEWRNSFEAFRDWALNNGWSKGLSIERKDVNGNYEPDNCLFITMKDQASNRRNNHIITHKGKTQTLNEWGKELGIKPQILVDRLGKLKWSVEKALSTPKIIRKKV